MKMTRAAFCLYIDFNFLLYQMISTVMQLLFVLNYQLNNRLIFQNKFLYSMLPNAESTLTLNNYRSKPTTSEIQKLNQNKMINQCKMQNLKKQYKQYQQLGECYKKQKTPLEQSENQNKLINQKYENQTQSQSEGHFTSRIHQLIKMRQKHQQIITKLTIPKSIQSMNIKNKMDHSTNNSKKDANSNVVNQKYMNIIEEYRLIHKEKKHIEDQQIKIQIEDQQIKNHIKDQQIKTNCQMLQKDPLRRVIYNQSKQKYCENCLSKINENQKCLCQAQKEYQQQNQNYFEQKLKLNLQENIDNYNLLQSPNQKMQNRNQEDLDLDLHVNLLASLNLFRKKNTTYISNSFCPTQQQQNSFYISIVKYLSSYIREHFTFQQWQLNQVFNYNCFQNVIDQTIQKRKKSQISIKMIYKGMEQNQQFLKPAQVNMFLDFNYTDNKNKNKNVNQSQSVYKYNPIIMMQMQGQFNSFDTIWNGFEDFQKIIQYLNKKDLWEGLFRSALAFKQKQKQNNRKSKVVKPHTSNIQDFQKFGKQNQKLFKMETDHYYKYWGLCFQSHKGQYGEPLLSEKPITQVEKQLLILTILEKPKLKIKNKNKNTQKNQHQDYQHSHQQVQSTLKNLEQQQSYQYEVNVDISYVLLYRLLQLDFKMITFPQMLHRLFGYGFRIFKSQSLKDYLYMIEEIDLLRQIHQKQVSIGSNKYFQSQQSKVSQTENVDFCSYSFQIYGFNKRKLRYQQISLQPQAKLVEVQNGQLLKNEKKQIRERIMIYQFRNLLKDQKMLKIFSQKYSEIAIVNQEELPVKSIQLIHNQNHFVVVSLGIVEEGLHFFTLQNNILNLKAKTNPNFGSTPIKKRYRVCLLSSKKEILQCKVVNQRQNFGLYLFQEEHQLYISCTEFIKEQTENKNIIRQQKFKQQIKKKQNFNQNGFILYVQSRHIVKKHDKSQMDLQNQNLTQRQRHQFQLQLKMKQDYQNYTQMIIEQYVALSFLQQHLVEYFTSKKSNKTNCIGRKFPASIKYIYNKSTNMQKCIQIYRIHIKSLDLYVDAIDMTEIDQDNFKQPLQIKNNFQMEEKCEKIKCSIIITYQEQFSLCDKNYKKNQVHLINKTEYLNHINKKKETKINLVYLTKNTPIRQICLLKSKSDKLKSESTLLKHKIILQDW